MRALELLAPAKNLECGIAAIDHGADAVYIGAPHFGARAAAGNEIEDIQYLCNYAHQYGAKVYVTLNTIVYDDELEELRRIVQSLKAIHVDAILVQDMALVELGLHEIPLHASTQTDNRTAEKVRWLYDIGFSRVVLARELSVDEIATIHQAVPDVELEVFVHGALCVSYSGICYASQNCFHRSANRGECAQFCRMKFSLFDAVGKEIEHERYLLSLKDLNQSNHLQELIEAGATSFKIEGRLKDVSYVKNVTAAYSNSLNDIIRRYPDKYCRASYGQCIYTFTPNLSRTFNRGYTSYFVHGRQPDIVSFDTPKAIGEYVGTVKEIRPDSFNVAGVTSFANGDGLCFLNSDRQFEGIRANRVVGNRIYPYRMPKGLRAGIALYRNNDQEFERILSRPSAQRKIPVSMKLRTSNDGFILSAKFDHYYCEVNIPFEHQVAQRSPRENIICQLSKLGDTIYLCSDIDIPADFNFFIPNSVLSEMRRKLVEKLSQIRLGHQEEDISDSHARIHEIPHPDYPFPYLYNISNRLSQHFYHTDQLTAYELRGGKGPVMQCRHCIRYSLGYCVRRGGKKPEWHEPLYLQLSDGRKFQLEFDCKNCQMNVYA